MVGQFHPTAGIVVLVQEMIFCNCKEQKQFCRLPVSRQVAIPTELSAAFFDSAEDRRGEYAVMTQQTAVGSFWIRNFIVRRKC